MPKMSSSFLLHIHLHVMAKCQQDLGLWQSHKATGTAADSLRRNAICHINMPFSPRTAVFTLDDNQFIWSASSPHGTYMPIYCLLHF